MDAAELLRRATQRTGELPGAELTHPFGEDWDVHKVGGKVFMLTTQVAGQAMVTLKARPADAALLRQGYADVVAGYHMNKKHWITVLPGGGVDAQLLEDLVTESYLLVVEGLPRGRRPVNPETFGQV